MKYKVLYGKFVDSGNILASSINNNVLNLKFCYYFLLMNNELIESYFRGAGVNTPTWWRFLGSKCPSLLCQSKMK